MIELELLGVGADGLTLVFTDAEGERYRTPITDELRAASRRDRPRIESAPSPARQSLRPNEIQALLRAGATPEDIAVTHGVDVTQVLKYEAPVQAEKDYALQRALDQTLGSAEDGPRMGDLVVDRLAARGVDPSSLSWTAQRESNGPWQIILTFIQGAAEHGAHWTLAPSGILEAVDQEAQWLTETISTTPAASIFTPLPHTERTEAAQADGEDLRAREALVDELNAARGKRQEIEYDLDEEEREALDAEEHEHAEAPSSISARIYSLAQARTKGEDAPQGTPSDADTADTTSQWIATPPSASPTPHTSSSPIPSAQPARVTSPIRSEHTHSESLPGLEDLPGAPGPKKSKSRRRSVPSWDEIVFGAKPQ